MRSDDRCGVLPKCRRALALRTRFKNLAGLMAIRRGIAMFPRLVEYGLPALDPSPVIPSDLSFGYLSAERKSTVKIPFSNPADGKQDR